MEVATLGQNYGAGLIHTEYIHNPDLLLKYDRTEVQMYRSTQKILFKGGAKYRHPIYVVFF